MKREGRGGVKGQRHWDSHEKDAEMENVLFLISAEGGGLRVEDACARLGLGFDGIDKRLSVMRREAREQ